MIGAHSELSSWCASKGFVQVVSTSGALVYLCVLVIRYPAFRLKLVNMGAFCSLSVLVSVIRFGLGKWMMHSTNISA